jgi:hypothetical protein
VDEILYREKLLSEKQGFGTELEKIVSSKEKMVACTLYHLQIPRECMRLVILDVKACDIWPGSAAQWP